MVNYWQSEYFAEPGDSDDIYHTGVKGMRWGVKKALRKARRDAKYSRRSAKLKKKSAKYEYKAAKAEMNGRIKKYFKRNGKAKKYNYKAFKYDKRIEHNARYIAYTKQKLKGFTDGEKAEIGREYINRLMDVPISGISPTRRVL